MELTNCNITERTDELFVWYYCSCCYWLGWSNPKPQGMLESSSSFVTSFMEPQGQNQNQNHSVPKLEDFLGDSSSSMMRYSESQTDTQDSSTLTHIYDQNSAYFSSDQQDLKAIAGFLAFSTNSGSEVDDSSSIAKTQANEFAATHSIESSANELTHPLSLAVTQCSDQKPIVAAAAAADSDSSKKITDTFGQRTSIYRGVTRYTILATTIFHFGFFCFVFLLVKFVLFLVPI